MTLSESLGYKVPSQTLQPVWVAPGPSQVQIRRFSEDHRRNLSEATSRRYALIKFRPKGYCLQCGNPITNQSHKKGKTQTSRKFCSIGCCQRNGWVYRLRSTIELKAQRQAWKAEWKGIKDNHWKDHPIAIRFKWRKRYEGYFFDEEFRLKSLMRTSVRNSLTKLRITPAVRVGGRSRELVGCTPIELKDHLEALFLPGMSWDNYGKLWQIDHIKECQEFDLYSNLQPLWTRDNIRKGIKTKMLRIQAGVPAYTTKAVAS